jgi:hypothetical protein
MSRTGRICFQLELDLTTQPIEGELRTAAGTSLPFVGWLGLTAALERAAGHLTDPIDPQEDPHGP